MSPAGSNVPCRVPREAFPSYVIPCQTVTLANAPFSLLFVVGQVFGGNDDLHLGDPIRGRLHDGGRGRFCQVYP